ncbi:hypothetical protein J7394_10325 [Ruegeria sp. R13_0]|uniref:imm11 family protein n=1 Tax=Ruegeria sp. R13_0 TaxID=2821099 RepID=UPI001ADA79AA|nr:DUF1629 domain-containing protein [Ruegeria sp. R13_0]MBO9434600.1 hypothetical protein [Ruegeria sp. R13_0]
MPYLLKVHRFVPGEFFWEDVWPRDKQPENYARVGHDHGNAPLIKTPIPYKQQKGKLLPGGVLPDLMPGRWSGDLLVSHRVKKLIDDSDIVQHQFLPVDLTLKDKSTVTGQYFLFVAGDLTDGIVPEASNKIVPQYFDGELGYYSCEGDPEIAWNEDSVRGRQIWVNKYLPRKIFISDSLHNELETLKLKAFTALPSAVVLQQS